MMIKEHIFMRSHNTATYKPISQSHNLFDQCGIFNFLSWFVILIADLGSLIEL